jgi:uridine kinase
LPESGQDRALREILARLSGDPAEVVLLDGPSGAGKSTLADALVAAWPGSVRPTLVRMDDIYPGWGGLAAAGDHVGLHLLSPRQRGGRARWQRHDWERNASADWNDVDPRAALLVEGCGVLTKANAVLATLTVWLDADDAVRKKRALARDQGAFDAHWDEWDAQFVEFVHTEEPVASADLVLRSD